MNTLFLRNALKYWRVIVVGLAAVLVLVGIIWAPLVPWWGVWHPPHARPNREQVLNGETISQTFLLEGKEVDSIVVWLDPLKTKATTGNLQLELDVDGQKRVVIEPVASALSDGLVVFPIQPGITGRTGEPAAFHISLQQADAPVYFQFQIDGTIFPQGAMTHSARYVEGDLAFQVHYQTYPLGAWRWQILYAALLALAAGLVWWAWNISFVKPEQVLARADSWMALGLGVVAWLFYAVLWLRPGVAIMPGDFVKDASYLLAGQQALWHGAWPVWSQLMCGGLPLLANPESNVLSLGSLFTAWLPANQALWLLLAVEAGMGAAGMYVLARYFKVSRLGGMLAVLVAVGGTAYAYRVSEGFTMLGAAVAFVPWIIWGFCVAQTKAARWGLALSGVGLVLMFWRGEVHVLTGLVLLLGWLTVWYAVRQKSWWAFLVTGAIIGIFFWGASVKILPYLEQAILFTHRYKPYVVQLTGDNLWSSVWLSVPDRMQKVRVRHGEEEDWANFGSYVGGLVLVLGLLGLGRKDSERWLVVAAGGFSLLLMEGTFYDVVLRQVGPLAGLLRLPTREAPLVLVWLGILAGWGLDMVRAKVPARLGLYVSVIMVLAVSLDLAASAGLVTSEEVANRALVGTQQPMQPVLALNENFSPHNAQYAGVLLRQGYVLPNLCADISPPPGFVQGLKPLSSMATVPVQLTPNRLVVQANSGQREVTINERFASGWAADHGWLVMSSNQGGLRLVRLGGGANSIDLHYKDGWQGVEILIVVLFGIGLIWYGGGSLFAVCSRVYEKSK